MLRRLDGYENRAPVDLLRQPPIRLWFKKLVQAHKLDPFGIILAIGLMRHVTQSKLQSKIPLSCLRFAEIANHDRFTEWTKNRITTTNCKS